LWDAARDQAEFDKFITIPTDLEPELQTLLISTIHEFWDCFYEGGVVRPILGFDFRIDTGSSAPVCCRQPRYGIFESKIILDQVNTLLNNGWIEQCGGAWGSPLVLAPKPHQETITNIDDFVWRMCVSYRKLNSVTLPFEYPIARCDDSLDNFGDSHGQLWFISLDGRTGFHQIKVHPADREKLAFFAPDLLKYCFNVMPFGPRNAPGVYTAMMRIFQTEWDALFAKRHPESVGTVGSKNIIDDTLLWCTDKRTVLLYFRCVCEIFQRYRVSFHPKKCDFFKSRVEWIGHDLRWNGNSPASSKFSLLHDWTLPTSGVSLHSFIGLCTYYNKFVPWFETDIKPLRDLERRHHRKPIPADAWTPSLSATFETFKVAITSDPCLARYDESMPSFLKTDWSALGMGYILMQPSNTADSLAALAILKAGGENLFDLLMNGARLRPVRFGSRRCNDREHHYHSFVGEAGAGRWAISQCRKYLWGAHFYWLCDCSAMKEILEYDGEIHQIRRWAQELLGYHFTIVHRPSRMMRDVDSLTRMYEPLVRQYITRAAELLASDRSDRPFAYSAVSFAIGNPFKCTAPTTTASSVATLALRVTSTLESPPQPSESVADSRESEKALSVARCSTPSGSVSPSASSPANSS
jgi:hypothetical protein